MQLLMMLRLLLRVELCLRWCRRLLLLLLCLASAAARRCCCRRHLLQMGRLRAFEDAAKHILHDAVHERVRYRFEAHYRGV